MKKSLLAIVFTFLIFSCDNYIDSSAKIDNYIPESSSVVLKINNISKFKNSIINNEYLNKLSNAQEYLIDAISVLEKTEFKDQVIICFYRSDETVFNIIGNPKNTDSLTNLFIINEKDFSVISNNPNVKRNNEINENFSLKFKNLDQTNTNFSISFNSNISGDLIDVFFNKDQALKKGNLYLNVETHKNVRSGLRSRADAFDIVFATASRVAQVSQVARITWVVAQKSSDIPSCFLKPAVTASDLQPLSNVSRRTELTAKGCISQSFASTRPRLKCQTFDLPSACSRKNCTSRQPLARISPTWRAFVRRLLFSSF